MTRRTLEIDTLAAFDAHVATTSSLNGWFLKSIDLSARAAVLRDVDPMGAVFLGCQLPDEAAPDLRRRGAMLFPRLPHLPFDPYRPGLYDAVELYAGTAEHDNGTPVSASPYAESIDAAIYAWSKIGLAQRPLDQTLAAALHDHAITDALDDALAPIPPDRVVGVMGGHALRRGEETFRQAARLGLELGRGGRMVLTGGGPGAMEAANLGAYLSPFPNALDDVLSILAEIPSFRPRIDDWAGQAFLVRERWPVTEAGSSFGIPTWFYGHEPTNAFATLIAKYFTNALREDTLLQRCQGGIVYLPGAAGTVQEIFQAVTENYYAADDTQISPMILVGEDYWTHQLPAWPLLESLGRDRAMGQAIHLVKTPEEATALLLG